MIVAQRPTWLQSYAKYWVVKTLAKIQKGRATFICRYEDDSTIVVGEKDTAVPDELNATIYVINPNFWTRFCIALDLVSRFWLLCILLELNFWFLMRI
jgi:cyclopropane-fatty-acyl-phospholipid synthase